jgi:hypothetical protein
VRHRLRRAGDHNARSRALTELQDLLGLPEAPLRIECYDMAHLQGTDYVGSMVVVEDGLPNKREYRRFKVKDVPGNDDYAAMEEVLRRRLTAYLHERDLPIGERPNDDGTGGRRPAKFAYPPQLLVVDGGKGQLAVAERVVRDLGLGDEIPIASLAKRFEEVYLPGRAEPVEVPRGSEALFMLQRIRDEAHRFANSFHRELRGKRMTVSSLDGIAGLGETRKKRLVQALGGVNAVKKGVTRRAEGAVVPPGLRAEAVHAKFPRRDAASDRSVATVVPEAVERLGAERLAELEGEVWDDELVESELGSSEPTGRRSRRADPTIERSAGERTAHLLWGPFRVVRQDDHRLKRSCAASRGSRPNARVTALGEHVHSSCRLVKGGPTCSTRLPTALSGAPCAGWRYRRGSAGAPAPDAGEPAGRSHETSCRPWSSAPRAASRRSSRSPLRTASPARRAGSSTPIARCSFTCQPAPMPSTARHR